jgi:1A family penicillin-binding protein
MANLREGRAAQGGSTLTQQLARQSFLSSDKTLRRKLKEAVLAWRLEHEFTKDQILELYLNKVYFGDGLYGVEAASLGFFGKHASDLDVAEAALLAGLVKSPSTYAPTINLERAVSRRNVVLTAMRDTEVIDATTFKRSVAERPRLSDALRAEEAFGQYFKEEVRKQLVQRFGWERVYQGGLKVYTTIDLDMQKTAETEIARSLAEIEKRQSKQRRAAAPAGEPLQAALVSMDASTGEVRAMVGGRSFDQSRFNRATQARRQAGSAFKPFVYAAAIAAGLSPGSIVDDEPVEIMIGNTPWIPANYDDNYQGRTTLRRALMLSANAATVRVSRVVGEPNVIAAARRNGITSEMEPHPSLALGAIEVTPLELVASYAPFANGGIRVKPRLVTRIEAPDGKVLWSTEIERAQAMDPRDAYEVTSMLRGAVDFGTGRSIRDNGITGQVAGKTGTTNSGNDVWFIGYTPTLVAGVWFGYDTPTPIADRAAGGRFAAPAWADFYKAGWSERAGVEWLPPNGMVSAIIDPESGELATEYCPRKVREWFKPGSEPQTQCEMHLYPMPSIAADDGTVVPGGPGRDDWLDNLGKKLKRILRF